jgi:hypothetical protein
MMRLRNTGDGYQNLLLLRLLQVRNGNLLTMYFQVYFKTVRALILMFEVQLSLR